MAENFNHPAEAAVLGLLHLASTGPEGTSEAEALVESTGLTAEDFHLPVHAELFRAATRMLATRRPLAERAWAHEVGEAVAFGMAGGRDFLRTLLAEADVLDTSFPVYAKSLRSLTLRRRLVAHARSMAERASSPAVDPEALAAEGAAFLANVGETATGDVVNAQVDFSELLGEMQEIRDGKRAPCIATGIGIWDQLLGGLQSDVLTFIGAQPSVGKSALIATMVENLAMAGVKVGLFSLEDHPRWLVDRMVSRRTGIPVRVLRTGPITEAMWDRVNAEQADVWPVVSRIERNGRADLTGSQIAAIARKMIVRDGCRAIFLDHVGEIESEGGHDRHDLAVAASVKALRDVAKEMRVPVVVLAHFKRPQAKGDAEPRFMPPTSAMWANSASIERMARVAVGLWLKADKPGEVFCSVLKQTNGRKDFTFSMKFDSLSGLVSSRGGSLERGEKGYDESPAQASLRVVGEEG